RPIGSRNIWRLGIAEAGQGRHYKQRGQCRAGTKKNARASHQPLPIGSSTKSVAAMSKRNGHVGLTITLPFHWAEKKGVTLRFGKIPDSQETERCKKQHLNAPLAASNICERVFEDAGTGAGIPVK